ncbi:MAG: hypothetical protein H6736_18920 [Alphaproteobacteria bacterium]|nr:hypothetical protein [Alphaproteobacteria bacterium]
MDRRELIGGGLAATLLGGCATLGGPPLEGMSTPRIPDFLVLARDRVRRMREPAVREGGARDLQDLLVSRGHRPNLMEESAAAMLLASTFRDLPEEHQRHPDVQAWVRSESSRMVRATYEMGAFLDGLGPDERQRISTHLRAHPERADELVSGLELEATRRGAHRQRGKQARHILETVSFRTRTQGVGSMIDEHVDRLDRSSRRAGFDWRDYDTLLAAADADGAGGMHPVIKAGLYMLGIGGSIAATGVLMVVIGAAAGSAGLTIFGFVVIVIGLFVAALGGLTALVGVIIKAGGDRQ